MDFNSITLNHQDLWLSHVVWVINMIYVWWKGKILPKIMGDDDEIINILHHHISWETMLVVTVISLTQPSNSIIRFVLCMIKYKCDV